MGGANTQTTNQTQNQSSQTNPWAATIPSLQNLIQQISGGGAPLTSAQSGALTQLQQEGGALPNFGAAGTNAVNNLFTSSTAPQVGMLGDAYKQFQSATSPYLNSNYTNPYTNPALSSALGTMNQDITNQVNSEFAAAGRTGSPANTQALARGLAQGEGGLLTGEYNTLVGQQQNAIGSVLPAATGTAGAITGQQQVPLTNALSGISAAGAVPGLWTQPGQTNLGIAETAQQMPWQNMQMPYGMLTGLAGLGGQSTGTNTGTSTTSQPINPWTTAAGLGLGMFALSDARLKEDIEPIGLLFNGLPFYKYRFKGDDQLQTGVMAQDVERVMPDAVIDIGLWRGGPTVKAVNYERATGPMAMAA
jgi:hypothetical protein